MGHRHSWASTAHVHGAELPPQPPLFLHGRIRAGFGRFPPLPAPCRLQAGKTGSPEPAVRVPRHGYRIASLSLIPERPQVASFRPICSHRCSIPGRREHQRIPHPRALVPAQSGLHLQRPLPHARGGRGHASGGAERFPIGHAVAQSRRCMHRGLAWGTA